MLSFFLRPDFFIVKIVWTAPTYYFRYFLSTVIGLLALHFAPISKSSIIIAAVTRRPKKKHNHEAHPTRPTNRLPHPRGRKAHPASELSRKDPLDRVLPPPLHGLFQPAIVWNPDGQDLRSVLFDEGHSSV